MSQRLFTIAKVGVFLESYKPSIEKRRGEEVKVLVLSCRVQPFDAKHATALDTGVGGQSNIKATVFNMNNAEPRANFTGHDFVLGIVRQTLEIYASPDTKESRVAVTQAKISGTRVSIHTDNPNALVLVFKVAFGPVGREELEFVHEWYRGQKFVTFQEAEESLEFADADAVDEDDDAPKGAVPTPMFDTDTTGRPTDGSAPDAAVRQRLHSHANRKTPAVKAAKAAAKSAKPKTTKKKK